MTDITAKEKYYLDRGYEALVNNMIGCMANAEFSKQELLDAVLLAADLYTDWKLGPLRISNPRKYAKMSKMLERFKLNTMEFCKGYKGIGDPQDISTQIEKSREGQEGTIV